MKTYTCIENTLPYNQEGPKIDVPNKYYNSFIANAYIEITMYGDCICFTPEQAEEIKKRCKFPIEILVNDKDILIRKIQLTKGANKIKLLTKRKNKPVTKEIIANESGVPLEVIEKVMKDVLYEPSYETIEKLCDYLKCDKSKFVERHVPRVSI